MTHGYCPYTTVAAVKAADIIIGPNREWAPHDKVQAGWLSRFYRPIVGALPKVPEIVSNATYVAEEHVAFLKRHGWDAELTACPPRKFLTASVFDLLVKWKTPGASVKIRGADGTMYPGAKLDSDVGFWVTDDGQQLACIATETDDRVWLAMMDAPPAQLGLADVAQRLLNAHMHTTRHAYLHFPMVDLVAKESLDWLSGLSTLGQDGQEWELEEAVQQITLKMNHLAARARAKDEMRFGTTSVPPPPLMIDKPFLVVFERPGLPQPLFTAYVTQESWKDPGTI